MFPGCRVLLWGIGIVTGLSGVNIERPCSFLSQWGSMSHLGGRHPIPFLRPFDSAQGERNSPPLGMDSGSGGTGSAGGCAFRRDGFLPPQERRMEGGERDVLAELGRLSLDPSTRLPPRRMFHPRQGERPRARRWIPARGVPARRGVRFQEGWIPASAGKTDGGGWGWGD